MQQTTKYQFNLIEGGDDFSPNQLNENMEKVEEALTEQAESLTATMAEQAKDFAAALGAGGQNCRLAYGSYAGTGAYGQASPTALNVGFAPMVLFLYDVSDSGSTGLITLIRGHDSYYNFMSSTLTITWSATGVSWYNDQYPVYQYNQSGHTYLYCVLGYSGN